MALGIVSPDAKGRLACVCTVQQEQWQRFCFGKTHVLCVCTHSLLFLYMLYAYVFYVRCETSLLVSIGSKHLLQTLKIMIAFPSTS